MSNTEYLWCFKSLVNIVHTGRVTAYHHPGLTEEMLKDVVANTETSTALEYQRKESGKAARTRYLAILFLDGADNHRYRNIKTNLYNKHLINKDT